MTDEPDPSFFSDRGISEEVWRARPYIWWTPDDSEPAKEPFSDLSAAQRAFVTKLVNQSPGWIITRQPPPMLPLLPRVYPELRPLMPVKTQGPRTHWHGDGEPPEDLHPWQRMPGSRENWQPHIDRAKDDGDHRGVNAEQLHTHQSFAKYVFATSALVDQPYEHDHETAWSRTGEPGRSAKRLAHISKVKCHDGVDVDGPHWHVWRTKGSSAMARRIDVHPMAVLGLIQSPVVFFVIEGCIKADAVLSDGGAVFSVPSVSLWECDELGRFASEFLLDKTVVIVPDADWIDNAMVINQAKLCQTALNRFGVQEVHVAAPPRTFNGRNTKGVDDFIGAGGHLDDLTVIDNYPPAGLNEWIASRTTGRDQARRDEWLLWALATYTGSSGRHSRRWPG